MLAENAQPAPAGLDSIASRVTPPISGEGQISRRQQYRLRDTAGTILQDWRVNWCGKRPYQGHVDCKIHAGRAHFAGIETCGSVWTCAVCGAKVAECRKHEVAQVCEKHMEAGGSVYMVTLTVRHSIQDDVGTLRAGVAKTWQRVLAGAPWARRRQRHGIRGYVRALEVTHGAHGWHPHLHVLIFMNDDQADEFGAWLYERWAKFAEKNDLGFCSADAFKFEKCYRVTEAGDYVTKWAAAAEITKSTMKLAGQGGRSPWQLLDDAAKGDKRAVGLFRAYAGAFKGARQLTWSRGLKDWAGIGDDPDETVAAREAEGATEDVCQFPNLIWREICQRGLRAEVLEAAETGGIFSVIVFLRSKGIRYDGTAPPQEPVADRSRQPNRRSGERIANGANRGGQGMSTFGAEYDRRFGTPALCGGNGHGGFAS